MNLKDPDVPIIENDREKIYLYINHDVFFGRAQIKINNWWLKVGEVIIKKEKHDANYAIEKLREMIQEVREAIRGEPNEHT